MPLKHTTATSATAPRRGRWNVFPPMPLWPQGKGETPLHIFCYCFLKADAASASIQRQVEAQWKSNHYKATLTTEALCAAFHALNKEAEQDLRNAIENGELLLCWHGTKATEVAL